MKANDASSYMQIDPQRKKEVNADDIKWDLNDFESDSGEEEQDGHVDLEVVDKEAV